jgi:bifunctional DNA-binding transcriptional regulator/antitoxin component of YhaV-PrlF toxin-antitoxin module
MVVRKRRRGSTRVSAKNQITIPADALRGAGLGIGERLVARADGPGRIILEREDDVVDEFAGTLTGTWEADELTDLRDEWD